ncbi:MAG: hypothetical protein ACO1NM_13455 [Sphingobium phenoxybenzoativorans]
MNNRYKIWRSLIAIPCIFLLTAARTAITPLPQTLMDENSAKIGEHFTAKVGDILLRAPVFDTETMQIEAPAQITIAEFSQNFSPGESLTPVLVPEKTETLVGQKGRYYCGEDLRTRSKFAAAMIGDLGSKFEAIVRFCFIDNDNDAKLDHVFLAGAKTPEFQRAITITPIPFTRKTFTPDKASSEIRLKFAKLDAVTGKVQLEVELIRDGKEERFDYMLMSNLAIGGSSIIQQDRILKTNPKKLPYPMHFKNILGANVGITEIDTKSGEAKFVINHKFGPILFKPVTIEYQTIYVYVG